MYIIFFLIWVIFNGQLTVEIAAFGLVVSGVMYAFICKFMDYKPGTDAMIAKKIFCFLHYIGVLLKEIIKANYIVIKKLTSSRYEIEPAVVRFKADLQSNFARILLANSITLTPGTITVTLEGSEYQVHCLDESLAEGLAENEFAEYIRRLEEI